MSFRTRQIIGDDDSSDNIRPDLGLTRDRSPVPLMHPPDLPGRFTRQRRELDDASADIRSVRQARERSWAARADRTESARRELEYASLDLRGVRQARERSWAARADRTESARRELEYASLDSRGVRQARERSWAARADRTEPATYPPADVGDYGSSMAYESFETAGADPIEPANYPTSAGSQFTSSRSGRGIESDLRARGANTAPDVSSNITLVSDDQPRWAKYWYCCIRGCPDNAAYLENVYQNCPACGHRKCYTCHREVVVFRGRSVAWDQTRKPPQHVESSYGPTLTSSANPWTSRSAIEDVKHRELTSPSLPSKISLSGQTPTPSTEMSISQVAKKNLKHRELMPPSSPLGIPSLGRTPITSIDLPNSRPASSGFWADLADSTSDKADAVEGLKSNIARNQNGLCAARPVTYTHQHHRPSKPSHRRVYEDRLELRAGMYKNSLLGLSNRQPNFFRPTTESFQRLHKLHSTLPSYGEDNTGVGASEDLLLNYSFADRLQTSLNILNRTARLGALERSVYPSLIWTRNLADYVYGNCFKLQMAQLTQSRLNVIVLPNPHNPVVEMNTIQIREIKKLKRLLGLCITEYVDDGLYQTSEKLNPVLAIVRKCCYNMMCRLMPSVASFTEHLDALDTYAESISRQLEPMSPTARIALGVFKELLFARCTLQRLDLMVLSFEGAHSIDLESPFDLPRIGLISIPGWEETPQNLPSKKDFSGCLRRLPLKCLAGLLENQEIWVFCEDDHFLERQEVYLSTSIETFADVWGPVWRIADQQEPDKISQYNVGGGALIPWNSEEGIHPTLTTNERLCHWTSDTDCLGTPENANLMRDERIIAKKAEEQPFDGSELLLIGAHKYPRLQWHQCKCSVDRLKQHLKESGRLNHIMTSKSYRSVDSQQASLVLGSHGIQIGGNKTYKTIKEEPLKKGLLAAWENEPQCQDPREFENFWGVAVSLCTMNARRVRLVELLGENSVLGLLSHFSWTDQLPDGRSERRRRFIKAVRSPDPRALSDLWETIPQWRKDIGKALVICLRTLFKTGYHKDRDEFDALWLPSGSRGPKRVTIASKDQRWVKILRDTSYSMTVAVIIEDKLGLDPPCGSSRWTINPPVLETAISINESLDRSLKLLKQPSSMDMDDWIHRMDGNPWKRIWYVERLGAGDQLWMGPEHRLRVVEPLTKWHLLLEVDTVKRTILRDMIGLQPCERPSHWEYLDDEDESPNIRPVPVHVVGYS